MSRASIQPAGGGRAIAIGPTTNRILIGDDATNGRFGLIEMELTPGFAGPPLHAHEQIEHVWYVLSGRVAVVVGDVETVLEPGACALVPPGTPHRFGNAGDVPARLLEFDAPRTLESYFDDLAAAFPPGSEIDPALIGPILARHDTRVVTAERSPQ